MPPSPTGAITARRRSVLGCEIQDGLYKDSATTSPRASAVAQPSVVNWQPCRTGPPWGGCCGDSAHTTTPSVLSGPPGACRVTPRAVPGANLTGRRSKSPPQLTFPVRPSIGGPPAPMGWHVTRRSIGTRNRVSPRSALRCTTSWRARHWSGARRVKVTPWGMPLAGEAGSPTQTTRASASMAPPSVWRRSRSDRCGCRHSFSSRQAPPSLRSRLQPTPPLGAGGSSGQWRTGSRIGQRGLRQCSDGMGRVRLQLSGASDDRQRLHRGILWPPGPPVRRREHVRGPARVPGSPRCRS